jgi:hypothetical protein
MLVRCGAPMTGVEVSEFAKMIRRTILRKCADLDGDDIESFAACATWELFTRTGKPLVGNRGYYFRAVELQLDRYVRKQRSAVTITCHAIRLYLEKKLSVDVWDHAGVALAVNVPSRLTASERVDARDQEVLQAELRRAMMRVVVTAGEKVLARTGSSKSAQRRQVRSFRQAVARDPAALAARRAIVAG